MELIDQYPAHKLEHILSVEKMVSFFEVTHPKNYYFPGEIHDFWEVVCVLDGTLGVTAGVQVHTLSGGQIIFHQPMELHRLWSEKDSEPHVMVFSFVASGMGMERFKGRIFQLTPLNESILIEIRNLMPKVFEIKKEPSLLMVKKDHPIASQLIAINLERFFLSLLSSESPEDTLNHSPSARNYHTIISVMEQNKYKNCTVLDLAKQCNMSVSNLKKVFHKYVGKGVMEYFTSMKMKEAMELLKQGKSVSEITDLLSFSSQSYFSTVFKRVVGCSPLAYRDK